MGSSPLTRGKQGRRRVGPHPLGLIPAHAGKTPWWHLHWRWFRAHPRSRGENDALSGASSAWKGSSPLTRGKQWRRPLPTSRARLIPAHAGKTARTGGCAAASGAHPRSRGENVARVVTACLPAGSSPLTRGKHRRQAQRPGRAGLIPAHAGKTSPSERTQDEAPAHPRSRGENSP